MKLKNIPDNFHPVSNWLKQKFVHLDGLSNLLKGRPLSGLHPGDLPFPSLDLWLENAGLKSYY
jgi:hypothetical protein